MNRFTAAIQTLLGKREVSITDPKTWRDETFAELGPDLDGAAVLGLSAVWACVNLVAGTIASLPLMVYQTRADGSRIVAADHPLYRMLHDSPNSLQTAVDFWEFMEGSLELWGNGYARKLRSGGRLVGLLPIMPQLPQVRSLGNGRLGYRWSEDGQSFDLTSDDVLHIRGFGGNPKGGMSTLAFGAKTFNMAMSINRAASATFKNGLRPSVVLSFKEWLSKERRDEITVALQQKYQGDLNAGRPFIAEGGQTVSTLTMNPEDAQMLESRAFSVEEICRLFGVPPYMVGHTSTSTSWGTGLEQQTLGFVQFALRRRLKRIEQAIEKQLLTAEDRALGIVVEFNLEGLLRGDSQGRSQFYTAALGDTQKPGWMVRNEVRRLENLPPIEGWNQPIPLISEQEAPAAIAAPVEDIPVKRTATPTLGTKRADDEFPTKDFAFKLDDLSDAGTFTGYGSIFGNLDSYGEVVEAGAFAKSLSRLGKEKAVLPMLWQHDPSQPIGVWEDLVEDAKGLKGTGRIVLETAKGAEAYALLKAGAIRGLSIGYREIKVEPDGNNRRLKELDLREISVVTFPANRRAQVGTVKSILDVGALPTVREFEEFLRDAGFSKALATAIAAKATPHLRGDPGADADDVLSFLRALSA